MLLGDYSSTTVGARDMGRCDEPFCGYIKRRAGGDWYKARSRRLGMHVVVCRPEGRRNPDVIIVGRWARRRAFYEQ